MRPFPSFLVGCALPALCASLLGREPEEPRLRRSVETCSAADVVLVDQEGQPVRFRRLLETPDPIVLNFIYGNCTTICPILSAGFATLQARLDKNPRKVRLVSLTIDPRRDTPPAMKAYLRRFRARPGWDVLTGAKEDVDQAMHGLNTFIPDLPSMVPITLIRPAGSRTWIRIFGLMSSSEFVQECRRAGIL